VRSRVHSSSKRISGSGEDTRELAILLRTDTLIHKTLVNQ
jgi:hypothetical protein